MMRGPILGRFSRCAALVDRYSCWLRVDPAQRPESAPVGGEGLHPDFGLGPNQADGAHQQVIHRLAVVLRRNVPRGADVIAPDQLVHAVHIHVVFIRVKTDAVDAWMLAMMDRGLGLVPDNPVGENQHELKKLQMARMGLVKNRTRLMNRVNAHTLAFKCRQTKAQLAQVPQPRPCPRPCP